LARPDRANRRSRPSWRGKRGKLIHLDQRYWRSGWVETPKDEWSRRVAELVAGDRWIIDGNYSGSLVQRLARADTVIDLRFPATLCVWRILRRIVNSRDNVRPDMAEGCPEQFNLEFLVYTATFPWTARKRTDARLAKFTGQHIVLRSPAEVRPFLASFGQDG